MNIHFIFLSKLSSTQSPFFDRDYRDEAIARLTHSQKDRAGQSLIEFIEKSFTRLMHERIIKTSLQSSRFLFPFFSSNNSLTGSSEKKKRMKNQRADKFKCHVIGQFFFFFLLFTQIAYRNNNIFRKLFAL